MSLLCKTVKYYALIGACVTGYIGFGNIVTSLVDDSRREFMKENPKTYALNVAKKSGFYGALWPEFCFQFVYLKRDDLLIYENVRCRDMMASSGMIKFTTMAMDKWKKLKM